ncbi:MAG: SGNH/GDSL hydrolase family protein [Clostridia bacterium]|nr:SGNH/GDSL hydrolase family protein [Clostridia bacterium]
MTGVMLFACGGCGDKPETPKAYNPFDPFWEGETVYNEPVVLVKDDATGEIKGNLLFAPTEIIEVKNYSLETTYDPSEYTVEGSTFKATASSTMPFMTEANLRGEGGEDYGYAPYPGSNIAFTEGVGLVMQQVNVTYKHKGAWGVKPTVQSQDIPNAMAKLKKGEDINLFVFGDSISTGANSSGKLGIAPYLPTYPQGVANQLTAKYGSKVNLYNGSVGGWMSSDGLTNIAAALPTAMNGNIPDLAIVGFGMNDGSLRVPATTYTDNVLRIIGAIREYAPNCDIVLISTILANPESPQNTSFTPQYLAYDRELANTVERVALVDMMTLSQELYKHKRGVDLLANNINHPNDFLTRCYVANIIGTICG